MPPECHSLKTSPRVGGAEGQKKIALTARFEGSFPEPILNPVPWFLIIYAEDFIN